MRFSPYTALRSLPPSLQWRKTPPFIPLAPFPYHPSTRIPLGSPCQSQKLPGQVCKVFRPRFNPAIPPYKLCIRATHTLQTAADLPQPQLKRPKSEPKPAAKPKPKPQPSTSSLRVTRQEVNRMNPDHPLGSSGAGTFCPQNPGWPDDLGVNRGHHPRPPAHARGPWGHAAADVLDRTHCHRIKKEGHNHGNYGTTGPSAYPFKSDCLKTPSLRAHHGRRYPTCVARCCGWQHDRQDPHEHQKGLCAGIGIDCHAWVILSPMWPNAVPSLPLPKPNNPEAPHFSCTLLQS